MAIRHKTGITLSDAVINDPSYFSSDVFAPFCKIVLSKVDYAKERDQSVLQPIIFQPPCSNINFLIPLSNRDFHISVFESVI